MKSKIKEKWLDALRSGEYEQSKHRLRSEDGFCCLGVLCDLYAKEKNIKWDKNEEYEFMGNSNYLPKEVHVWADIDRNGVYKNGSLANDNDKEKSFSEIAEIIEKEF